MANLQSLSSAVLDNAKQCINYKNWLHFVTFICAISSIFMSGELLYVSAVIALLSEFVSWLLSLSVNNKKSLGQELIRLNILQSAFGSSMKVDVAYLKSKVSKNEYKKASEFDTEAYYATSDADSEKRLVDIIQESCFWSQHLYYACKKKSIAVSIFLGVVIVVLIVTGLAIIDTDNNYSLPRLSLLFLMFFPLWNSVENAISYGSGSAKLSSIDQQLNKGSYDLPNILALFADYNVVTSNTPLIPQSVYESEKEKLSELWAERCVK